MRNWEFFKKVSLSRLILRKGEDGGRKNRLENLGDQEMPSSRYSNLNQVWPKGIVIGIASSVTNRGRAGRTSF
jgi:hypothetical protein